MTTVQTTAQKSTKNPFPVKLASAIVVKPAVVKATPIAVAKPAKPADPNKLESLTVVAKPSKPGDYLGEGLFFLPGARPSEQAIRMALSAMLIDGTKIKQAQLSTEGEWIWTRLVFEGEEDFWAVSRDKDAQNIGYKDTYTANRAAWAALDPSGFMRAEQARINAQTARRDADKAQRESAKALIEATTAKITKPATVAKTAAPVVKALADKAPAKAPTVKPAKTGKPSPFSKK